MTHLIIMQSINDSVLSFAVTLQCLEAAVEGNHKANLKRSSFHFDLSHLTEVDAT